MSQNRILRRIFGPKRKEVTGDWRKLRNKELHNLHSSPNIIRMIKSRRMNRAAHVACTAEIRNEHKVFVGKRQEKKPLGSWEDNISKTSPYQSFDVKTLNVTKTIQPNITALQMFVSRCSNVQSRASTLVHSFIMVSINYNLIFYLSCKIPNRKMFQAKKGSFTIRIVYI
jgi:hypothetical protein